MVWYCDCALPVVPSFSEKGWKGVLAVPLLAGGLLAPPKALPVLEPKPPVVAVLVEPNAPPVLPPPNRPLPPVVDEPKPVVLFWPKRLPPVFVLLPKAEVVLLVDPKPPNVLPPVVLPPPKRPPPVVELPKGFEPKAVLLFVFAPKPPGELSQFLIRAFLQYMDPRAK